MRKGADRRLGLRPPVLAGLALLLLLGAAASLPGRFAVSRRAGRVTILLPDPPALAGYLVAAIATLMVLIWIVLQVTGLRMRGQRGPRKAAPLWVQIAVLVLALLLPGLLGGPQGLFDRNEEGRPTPASEREPAPEDPSASPQRSRPLGIAVTILLAVVLFGTLAGIAWLLWPAKHTEEEGAPDADVLLEELKAGLDDLALIDDPRSAVIACYARMERLLERAGIERRPSDTPLELLGRVLREQRAAESSVARLTDLFERARFSSHPVDEAMRADAVEALREVHEQVGAPA
ncbi:hypothetical protein BH24ACT26_BH24ACT26_10900 [soil metagenome]